MEKAVTACLRVTPHRAQRVCLSSKVYGTRLNYSCRWYEKTRVRVQMLLAFCFLLYASAFVLSLPESLLDMLLQSSFQQGGLAQPRRFHARTVYRLNLSRKRYGERLRYHPVATYGFPTSGFEGNISAGGPWADTPCIPFVPVSC